MSSLALNQATILFKNLVKVRNSKTNSDKNVVNDKRGSNANNVKNTDTNNLMLSYYNLAVQQEFLKRNNDANISYSYCQKLGNRMGAPIDNLLINKLKKVFISILTD